MSDSVRSGAVARRNARIAEHLRRGLLVTEICDIEGLDPANEPRRIRKEVAEPNGLTVPTGKNTKPPVGLMDTDKWFRHWLGKKLRDLRDNNHYVEVSALTGLTNSEQTKAMSKPWTHNWTLAQIQRLAAASSMTFQELLDYAQQGPPIDLRKNK